MLRQFYINQEGTYILCYNDKISRILWQSADIAIGTVTSSSKNGYSFTYDDLSLRSCADYLEKDIRSNQFSTSYL